MRFLVVELAAEASPAVRDKHTIKVVNNTPAQRNTADTRLDGVACVNSVIVVTVIH